MVASNIDETDAHNKNTPSPKKMSKGESKVQELLRIQREKIKKMNGQDNEKTKVKSNEKSGDWIQDKSQTNNSWIREKEKSRQDWIKKKKETLRKWAEKKAVLKKVMPKLVDDLTDLREFEVSEEVVKSETKKIKVLKKPNVNHFKMALMKESFLLPIRNQGFRSTCSAFAGVRAMEIINLRKNPAASVRDLSEQYFYYAAKPKCKKSPCSKKGSWPLPAFNDFIPSEKNCPYSLREVDDNETQIPLSRNCSQGEFKISQFSKVKSRDEIQRMVGEGKPVIGGFKLNDKFYENKGYINLGGESDALMDLSKSNRHAAGHALLIVGVMDLPKELWATEGRRCSVVANSWGEGWGLGGHACLTDAWFDQYRYDFDFLAVEDISLR